jgi:cysteine desulfurase
MKEIYLDYMASTPCDPSVLQVMIPLLVEEFANPSSSHRAGGRAKRALEQAREECAAGLLCEPYELAFTSGATESNNLAILGTAAASDGVRRKIITTPIEHSSVLEPCRHLARKGYELVYCPVDRGGEIDLGALADLIDDRTLLVSVQAANNEIGTLQPVSSIGQLARSAGALFHCDASQAFGKIPLSVEEMCIDLLSLSGHKTYGPKGVGALYIRGGVENGSLEPLSYGGGQEYGLRPGTSNVPAIAGFGCACRLAHENMREESSTISALRDLFEREVIKRIPGVKKNGSLTSRLPGLTSITLDGVDADAVIANAPDLIISSSSACNAGAPEPSHVLLAIGFSREAAYSTLRVGLGRFTSLRELEYAAMHLSDAARTVRDVYAESRLERL